MDTLLYPPETFCEYMENVILTSNLIDKTQNISNLITRYEQTAQLVRSGVASTSKFRYFILKKVLQSIEISNSNSEY